MKFHDAIAALAVAEPTLQKWQPFTWTPPTAPPPPERKMSAQWRLVLKQREAVVARVLDADDQVKSIRDAVASDFGISVEQMLKSARSNWLPRRLTMYLLRDRLGLRMEFVAALVGRIDHTTASHAYWLVVDEVARGGPIVARLVGIEAILDGGQRCH